MMETIMEDMFILLLFMINLFGKKLHQGMEKKL